MGAEIQKALVTGGSGFIGTALCKALLNAGVSVRNLDFVGAAAPDGRYRHLQGSFLDHGLLREALSGVDCVFHLAASGFAREANRNPFRDAQENVLGTVNLLELACEAGVSRVVYCSSGGTVYGPSALERIPETAPTNPITAYGVSKLSCEKYMRLYDATSASGVGNGRLSTLTLRVANPYGAGQNIKKAQGALTTFCYRAIRGEPIEIWGDGLVERDYVDVRDVAIALLAAAQAGHVSGTEINIGSGQGVSLRQLTDMLGTQLGRDLEVAYLPARSFDVRRNVLDVSKAANLLNWRPVIALERGMSDLLDDIRQRLSA